MRILGFISAGIALFFLLPLRLSAGPCEIDVLPLGGFDSSCPAMAQGPTRLARGLKKRFR